MARISIIIPNLNSPIIDRTLAGLAAQNFDLSQVEVLVVGRDEPGLVQPNDWVRLIATEQAGNPAQNRNRGLREASGEIVCFIDADCVPAPDWLQRLTAPYADPTVDVVGGTVAFSADNYWAMCDNISWFYRSIPGSPAGERSDLPSLNLSVRRRAFEKAGLFDESYVTGEDVEWTRRLRALGFTLHFEPRAMIEHCTNRSTFKRLWQHARQFGYYSPKNNPARDEGAPPYRWWWLLLLSPLLALLATGRIVLCHPHNQQVRRAVPGLWLSKMAWCWGGVQRLRHSDRTYLQPAEAVRE